MVAITTRSTTLLINKLIVAYPELRFEASDDFHWDPIEKVIFYSVNSSDSASLLHEVAHAALGHATFNKDIGLIELERDAWAHAKMQLGPTYDVAITDETIEQALDTYRDWLHTRSTCPDCNATGLQTNQESYSCIVCLTGWRVNDGRICALRRYRLHKNTSK